MGILILYLLAALVISALCSLLESTLLSTPLSYITMREEEGYKPAVKFKEYKQESSRPIAAILSLNTIANTIGAAGVGHQSTIVLGSRWFGLVSAVTTILILIFSEIIPKTIAANNWKHLMGLTTKCIGVLIILMFPFVKAVEWFTKILGHGNDEAAVSREEVSAMANVAEDEDVLDEDENTVIQNIIRMDDIPANKAMTPRVVCSIAPESMTVKSFYRYKEFRHYSRIPVYDKSDDYITGYILRTDALQLLADDKFDRTLGSIRRDIELFNEDKALGEIWDSMIFKKEQIACIIDEYGAFQGILTLEDIIETLFEAEIVDENDEVPDLQALARELWSVQQQKKKTGK